MLSPSFLSTRFFVQSLSVWGPAISGSCPSSVAIVKTEYFVAANRKLLIDDEKTINQVFEESKEGLTNIIDSVYGEECMTDRGCAAVLAFCDRREGFSGSLG